MSTHPTEERLNDFVDALLPAPERDAVAGHLAGCPACRTEVEGLRELLHEAAALPREVAPPPGLWGALLDEVAARPGWTRWTVRLSRRELAAAAIVLAAFSAGITAALLRDRGGPAPIAAVMEGDGTGAARMELQRAEVGYVRTAAELEAALAANRGALAPETAEVVEENLRIIDSAIREARAALELDPANAELSNVLAATHRDKIDVLERTLRLSAQT
ncbi:MAG TPA: zf-HC2 domain-containing protein [Longimicrobiaceae bacterium]|nr:zf-HC2 domain-containing protein [Longimicrobiaceae bacterium]